MIKIYKKYSEIQKYYWCKSAITVKRRIKIENVFEEEHPISFDVSKISKESDLVAIHEAARNWKISAWAVDNWYNIYSDDIHCVDSVLIWFVDGLYIL